MIAIPDNSSVILSRPLDFDDESCLQLAHVYCVALEFAAGVCSEAELRALVDRYLQLDRTHHRRNQSALEDLLNRIEEQTNPLVVQRLRILDLNRSEPTLERRCENCEVSGCPAARQSRAA